MGRTAGAVLGIVAIVCLVPIALGQAPGPDQPDLIGLSRRMAEEVQRLGEDIGEDLAQSPSGLYLIQDTRELAQAVDEFSASLQTTRDPFQLRQSYGGI